MKMMLTLKTSEGQNTDRKEGTTKGPKNYMYLHFRLKLSCNSLSHKNINYVLCILTFTLTLSMGAFLHFNHRFS